MSPMLTALAPYIGVALVAAVAIYGLTRIQGIGRVIGTVAMVAAGVILGGAILMNPGAIGQILSGTVGAVDPYGATVGAARAGQEVKRLQTEPDTVGASLAFDCELAAAAGELVNPAWCAQVEADRAAWGRQKIGAMVSKLYDLEVLSRLSPAGTILDTGRFDADNPPKPILIVTSITTTLALKSQREELEKALLPVTSVAPSSTVTTTARVAVPALLPTGFSSTDVENRLTSPLGTAPADAPEWIRWIYQIPAVIWIILTLVVLIILLRRR